VTTLAGHLTVVGTFDHTTGTADPPGCYRSAIVARAADHGGDVVDWLGRRAAVNGLTSLSGWISLRLGLLGALDPWPGEVVVTGSHVASLAAVADGTADVAAIDAVTLGLLRRHRPAALAGLAIVGTGPTIPCLPLVAAGDADAGTVAALRDALAATVRHPDTRRARAALLIDAFVPVDAVHYGPVRDLAVAAAGTPAPDRP
jgi:ABC-type phosphate/phosphonate transport system substrate-binding protein